MPKKYCSAFDSYCKHCSDGKCTKEKLGKNGNPCTFMVQVTDPAQRLILKYLRTVMTMNAKILAEFTRTK